MSLRKYRMETRHWWACSVLYAVPRAGDSVLNLISACQSDDWEGIFCCIRDIIKYLFAHNLPQPPTPSTSYTPVTTHTPPTAQTPQPPTPHNHQYPSTTYMGGHPSNHTPPKTTLIPKLRTLQNHSHPSNCPHPSTTHLNNTYPPTTHTWYQSILHKRIHWNKMTQIHEKH